MQRFFNEYLKETVKTMIYFLTSSPSVSVDGPINPANGFLDRLREALGNNPLHALFVTTYPDDAP